MQRTVLLLLALASLAGCIKEEARPAEALTIDLHDGCPALRGVRCGASIEITSLEITLENTTVPLIRVVGLDRPLEIRDVQLTGPGTLIEVQGRPGCVDCRVSIHDARLVMLRADGAKTGINLTHTTGLELGRVDASLPGGGFGATEGAVRFTSGAPTFVALTNGTATLDWTDVRVLTLEPSRVDAVRAYQVPTDVSWSNVSLVGFAGAGSFTGSRLAWQGVTVDCQGQEHGAGLTSYGADRQLRGVVMKGCREHGMALSHGRTVADAITVSASRQCIAVAHDDVLLRDVVVSACDLRGIDAFEATIGIAGGRIEGNGFAYQQGQRLYETGGLLLTASSGFVHGVSFLENFPFAAAYQTGNIWSNALDGHVLDATGNYWGPTGPIPFTDKVADELAVVVPGNHVQDEIRFTPWLTSPP